MRKEALLLETKKQVMQYKLKIKEQLEQTSKDNLVKSRAQRRAKNENSLDYQYNRQAVSDDDDYFDHDEYNAPSLRTGH